MLYKHVSKLFPRNSMVLLFGTLLIEINRTTAEPKFTKFIAINFYIDNQVFFYDFNSWHLRYFKLYDQFIHPH